jgi:hypothetical protein
MTINENLTKKVTQSQPCQVMTISSNFLQNVEKIKLVFLLSPLIYHWRRAQRKFKDYSEVIWQDQNQGYKYAFIKLAPYHTYKMDICAQQLS